LSAARAALLPMIYRDGVAMAKHKVRRRMECAFVGIVAS
jgi:hypothetical protein